VKRSKWVAQLNEHYILFGNTSGFLSAVQPAEAVISVGDNPYGHPAAETLQRLLDVGARIWRTDEQGTITVESDGFSHNISGKFLPIDLAVYLPMLIKETPPPPPDPTLTPPTPEPSPEPDIDVRISLIFYDGIVPYVESDEFAQVTNDGAGIVDLQDWRLNAGDPDYPVYSGGCKRMIWAKVVLAIFCF